MMTKKKTYVQPEIAVYDVSPCAPLATSVTTGQTEGLTQDSNDVEWDN